MKLLIRIISLVVNWIIKSINWDGNEKFSVKVMNILERKLMGEPPAMDNNIRLWESETI